MKRKIMAVLLSAALVMSSTVVAFAEDVDRVETFDRDVEVQGNVTSNGVVVEGEYTVDVTGSVTNDGSDTSMAIGVDAQRGATVNVGEDVTSETGMGVMVGGDSTVTVGGDITSASNGIEFEGPGTVTVGGSVDSDTEGIVAGDGAKATVVKDVQGGNKGILVNPGESGATVVVKGNVSSDGTGIEVDGSSFGGTGKVVVEGTISGEDDAVLYTFSEDHPNNNVQILAYKVEGTISQRTHEGFADPVYDSTGNMIDEGGEQYSEKTDASNLINYILKKTSEFIEYVSGITQFTVNETDYDTAKADAPVVIRTAPGYAANCEAATLTKNADGTYTLVVPQGGGVTLTAEQIQEVVQEEEQQQPTQPAAQPEQPAAQPEQPAAQPEQPAAQPEQPAAQPEQPAAQPEQPAAPVGEDKKEEEHQSSSSAQDQSALWPTAGTVVLAGYDEATALDPTSDPAAYVSAFVDKIANTPQGGTAELFVTDAAYLDDTIVQALVARSDVAIKLNVTVNGQALVINIPAGYNLSRLIGKGGKISMKKLIELFVQKK